MLAILPAPNQIQIDLDSPAALKFFLRQFRILQLRSETYGKQFRFRKTILRSRGGHWHAIVERDKPAFLPLERVALQAALGSDCTRELLNYMRILHGSNRPCMLFRND